MVATPGGVPVADTPVTVAVPGPVPLTIAMPGALLLHVPPVGVPVSVVVPPASQTCGTPVIAPGSANTVTVAVLRQPAPFVYVVLTVPALPPSSIPVLLPIVAVPVPADTDHVPPAGVADNVVVCPTQVVSTPVIAPGSALTVAVCVM